MRAYELSKRWMVMFDRDSAVKNLQFFETGLKVVPIVHVFWIKDGGWHPWAFAVAEKGHKPWDITEAHVAPTFGPQKDPSRELVTTFTAEEFRRALEDHPGDWDRLNSPPERPYGRKSYQPYDEKRNMREYINCVYPD